MAYHPKFQELTELPKPLGYEPGQAPSLRPSSRERTVADDVMRALRSISADSAGITVRDVQRLCPGRDQASIKTALQSMRRTGVAVFEAKPKGAGLWRMAGHVPAAPKPQPEQEHDLMSIRDEVMECMQALTLSGTKWVTPDRIAKATNLSPPNVLACVRALARDGVLQIRGTNQFALAQPPEVKHKQTARTPAAQCARCGTVVDMRHRHVCPVDVQNASNQAAEINIAPAAPEPDLRRVVVYNTSTQAYAIVIRDRGAAVAVTAPDRICSQCIDGVERAEEAIAAQVEWAEGNEARAHLRRCATIDPVVAANWRSFNAAKMQDLPADDIDQALADLNRKLHAPAVEIQDLRTKLRVLDRLSRYLDPSISAVLDRIAEDLRKAGTR